MRVGCMRVYACVRVRFRCYELSWYRLCCCGERHCKSMDSSHWFRWLENISGCLFVFGAIY